MKKILLVIALSLGCVSFTGCPATVSTQSSAGKTLLTVETTAKAGIDYATQLLKQGKITVPQYQKVSDFYDNNFQPALQLAISAAHADLSSIASPDVASLAAQLSDLIAKLTSS